MPERSMPGTRARPASVGKPRIIAYEWGKRTYPWADRRLALAEAVHGAPPRAPGRPGRPRKAPVPRPVPSALVTPPERCDGCGYLVTSPGHLAVCGDAA